jgi:hypothetical protein
MFDLVHEVHKKSRFLRKMKIWTSIFIWCGVILDPISSASWIHFRFSETMSLMMRLILGSSSHLRLNVEQYLFVSVFS